MKNTKKVAVATLTAACLVCGVVGLTACEPAVVSKISVGNNYIGTVTTEGKTFDVEGTVDTEYKLTATVGGETCNDILITVGDVINNGWVTFTYADDCEVTFKSTSDDIAKVTVVMEKYENPNIEPPVTETYELTVGTPKTLTDLKAGDNFDIKFTTETGMTYTVTITGDENVKFASKVPGGENESGPKSFNGADYDDPLLNHVATISMTAEANVATVTITLTAKETEQGGDDTPGDYDAISLGDTTVKTFPDTYEGTPAHYYSFVVETTTTYSVKADGFVLFGTDTVDGSWGEITQNVTLAAGTYTIVVVDYNGTDIHITISGAANG